jgi:hypothetical protein
MEYLEYGTSNPSIITLNFSQECEVMTIQNNKTISPNEVELLLYGHQIFIYHGRGNAPDSYVVVPRPGYVIDRSSQSAEENTSVTFNICPMFLS